jgi:3D (Asp-Asp-Asp) domain-containing protein
LRIGALALSLLALTVALPACADDREWRSMEVIASAYNATPAQTHPDHPTLTAWGDTLKPGMKAIAVSRDLIGLGMTHGTEVRIEGLPGVYVVRDKMHRRWREKIDIYMEDREAAREWGRRVVTIRWQVDPEDGEG